MKIILLRQWLLSTALYRKGAVKSRPRLQVSFKSIFLFVFSIRTLYVAGIGDLYLARGGAGSGSGGGGYESSCALLDRV